jgi:hypothetical protein
MTGVRAFVNIVMRTCPGIFDTPLHDLQAGMRAGGSVGFDLIFAPLLIKQKWKRKKQRLTMTLILNIT